MPHNSHITRTFTYPLLAAATTLIAILSTTSPATAGRFSVSSTTFRDVRSPLTVSESGGAGISCNVTLEGSFSSGTIAKVLGSLSGYVTRVSIAHETCREPIGFFAANAWAYNGVETILGVTPRTSLPWHLTYQGFTGTLPNIETIRTSLQGVRFAVQIAAKSCLGVYGGAEASVIGEAILEANGTVRSMRPERNASFALREGANCPNPAIFAGEGAVTVLGSTTRITIKLI